MQQRHILLALHLNPLRETYQRIFEDEGWKVTPAGSLELMMGAMAEVQNPPFSDYIMDVNLGHRGTANIEPGKKVYGLVSQRVKTGEVTFMAITGIDETPEIAKKEGIPCIDTLYLMGYVNKLLSG
ncbi:hypothetical protein HYU13_03855 [Candidatus Woesearchaeota archaeon]|nr:hypothetical protein [Candidatus Woesearchaeota archaeon]